VSFTIKCICGNRFDAGFGVTRLNAVQVAVRDGWREHGIGDFWTCPRCAKMTPRAERIHDTSTMVRGDHAVRYCDGCHVEHDFECFFIAPGGVRVGRAWCEKLKMDYTQFLAIDYPPARDARDDEDDALHDETLAQPR
jgi:uncharacterized C2H2 Zn-finger protein